MALTTNGSFLPTLDSFITSWTEANAALDPLAPVITATDATLADLVTMRANLVAWFNGVTDAINAEQLTRATLASHKEYVRSLCVAFNEAVRGRLATTSFPAALPLVVGTRAAPEDVLSDAADVLNLWGRINAAVPMPGLGGPLVLQTLAMGDPEGPPITLDVANFEGEVNALNAAFTAFKAALQHTKTQRSERDKDKRRAADLLRDYRAAIPGFFAVGDPHRVSLPDLYPAPGHTPEAVIATGTWDVAEAKGRIDFTPSDEATLARYAVRYSPGEEYDTEDDITLGTVEPGAEPRFFTLTGLAAPGDTGLFRVYVMLTTGNEKGSNTVTLTRPPA